MKRNTVMALILMFGCFISFASVGYGQNQMTQAQKDEFQKFVEYQKMKEATTPTVTETVSKYAGLGKEIGTIMREAVQSFDQSMTVTETHVYKFLDTGVGKVTMGIIVWKVLGRDIISVIVGSVLLIGFMIWCYHWVRAFFYGKMILATSSGPFYNRVKTYKRSEALNDNLGDAYPVWTAVAILGGLMFFAGSMICFFHA